MVRNVIISLAVFLTALACSEAYRYWSILRTYKQAREYARVGDHPKAFSLYRRISNLNSLGRKIKWVERDAQIFEYVYKRELGKLLTLIHLYPWKESRTIAVQFDRAEEYEYLGYVLASLDVSREAVAMFRKAILFNPKSPYAPLVEQDTPHIDKAWYDRLESITRGDPKLHSAKMDLGFGKFYRDRGMNGKAIEHFIRAMKGRDIKIRAQAHYLIGSHYEAEGLTQQAQVEYEKAISQVPTHIESLTGLNRLGLGYEQTIARLTPTNKLGVNLGDKIEVMGYDIGFLEDGRTAITFYLKTIGDIREVYMMWLHGRVKDKSLLEENRVKWDFMNFDHWFSPAPTRWRLGEVYKDVYIRQIRTGDYRLSFGIWSPPEHADIRLIDVNTGKHAIDLGWFELGLPRKED